VPDWVKQSFVIFNIRALWRSAERQSARCRMLKITNDCLTQSGTGCFLAVPIWQQWASKGWWHWTHECTDGHKQNSTLLLFVPLSRRPRLWSHDHDQSGGLIDVQPTRQRRLQTSSNNNETETLMLPCTEAN